jgi:hypothetical protein
VTAPVRNTTCLGACFAMILTRQRCTPVALLLLASACAVPEGVQIVDCLYPGAVAGDRGPFVTRLVDDFTGEPVVGAELFLVAESDTPIGGEFWWTHRGTSDAGGFVRIARPNWDRDWHIQVVRHPRHGTSSRTGHSNALWRLGAAYDVPVRILDWRGLPAPGARIGFCGGCGHTPDLVHAVADADGLAVLRGINPQNGIADLYVQHPGLHFFYDSVSWRPGDGPMPVRCAFGPAKTGRVVDHRGAGVGGAYVRVGGRHRGPGGRTAADGTFVVLGAEPNETPHTVVLPNGRSVYFPSPGRFPVTMQLPDLADAAADEGTIDVPEKEDAATPEVPVRTIGVRVEHAPSPTQSFDVEYPGRPQTRPADEPGRIVVPRSGPFVLWVHDESDPTWNPREFGFDDASVLPDPLVVTWTPDAQVTGQVVDQDGRPVSATLRWLRSAETSFRSAASRDTSADRTHAFAGGRIDVRRRPGWSLLEVGSPVGALRARRLWVKVPAPGTAPLELGELRLVPRPQLRVVDENVAPVPAALVAHARPGWHQAGEPSRWPIDADGGWCGPDLQAGDVVFLQRSEDHVPHRVLLEGPAPWTIVLPAGQLDLEVVDDAGEPLDGEVTFADRSADVEDGAVRLQGLPAGPLRCFVGSPGRRSAIVDAVVGTAPRTIRLVLPAR